MITSDLKALYIRDLDRLALELEAYEDEHLLWEVVGEINNSAGNLFMHICGNIQHFIGAILYESGYVRKRDFEFSGKQEKSVLADEIRKTKIVVDGYFSSEPKLNPEDDYPLQPFGYTMTVNYFLIHLNGHLNYHLGQINYHRRILSKS